MDFGRPAKWNCPMPESEQPSMVAVDNQSNVKYQDEGINSRGSYEEDEDDVRTATTRVNDRRRGGNRGNVRQQQIEDFDDSKNSASRTR